LSQPRAGTDEYAVMIDTRDPLEVAAAASAIERAAYVDSWRAADATPGSGADGWSAAR